MLGTAAKLGACALVAVPGGALPKRPLSLTAGGWLPVLRGRGLMLIALGPVGGPETFLAVGLRVSPARPVGSAVAEDAGVPGKCFWSGRGSWAAAKGVGKLGSGSPGWRRGPLGWLDCRRWWSGMLTVMTPLGNVPPP